jgi:hypothetical protein
MWRNRIVHGMTRRGYRCLAALPLLAICASACSERHSATTNESARATSVVAKPATTTGEIWCYGGTLTRSSSRVPTVLRLTFDRERSVVTEELSTKQDLWIEDNRLELAVSGDRFKVSGSLHGEGQLVGEPWRWTSWSADAKSAANVPISFSARRDPDGTKIEIGRSYPGGVTIHGELAAFDCAEYSSRHDALADGH